MVIATLGDYVFEVNPNKIKTFSDVNWNSSAKYAEHDRYLGDTLLEYVGCDTETISFSCKLSAGLGVNPQKELAELLTTMRNGEALRFTIGWKAYGKYRWVIESCNKKLDYFDSNGNILACDIDITLKSYSRR